MPEPNILATWINEANKRMSKGEDKHDELRIEFERLRTEVKTRNKIIWAMVGITLAATGTVIALITLISKLR